MTEDPISPEIRLAMCLYRLARGDYFYTISELFGCGRSTVCYVVNEVTEAIIEVLWEEHVSKHFPKNEQELKEKMFGHGRAMAVPHAAGAAMGWLPYTPQMPRWWFGSM